MVSTYTRINLNILNLSFYFLTFSFCSRLKIFLIIQSRTFNTFFLSLEHTIQNANLYLEYIVDGGFRRLSFTFSKPITVEKFQSRDKRVKICVSIGTHAEAHNLPPGPTKPLQNPKMHHDCALQNVFLKIIQNAFSDQAHI